MLSSGLQKVKGREDAVHVPLERGCHTVARLSFKCKFEM